jgi:hypothetical protein
MAISQRARHAIRDKQKRRKTLWESGAFLLFATGSMMFFGILRGRCESVNATLRPQQRGFRCTALDPDFRICKNNNLCFWLSLKHPPEAMLKAKSFPLTSKAKFKTITP